MKLNKLAMIGALAAAAISTQSFAATDATVNFNARLVAATCDVSASKDLISLGTHSIEKITDTATSLADANFNLVLNNCTKINGTTDVDIIATGEALTGHNDMFADAQASQIGVKLTANNIALLPNATTTVTDLKIVGTNDYIVPVKASLFATTKDAVAQSLNVPVTFSVAYN